MTINEKEINYYRTKIIGKYVTPIMDKYANEEIEYKKEQERVMRLLKSVRKNT
jgi:hypothetical protein